MYVKCFYEIVYSKSVSTAKFECLAVGVVNMRSHNFYTVIVVYKAPTCIFEYFKAHFELLVNFQISDKLIIVGDFNFDMSSDQKKTFMQFMKSVFPKAEMLNTVSTTLDNTILDLCFTTCNRANADVLACVWSYHHTLIVSVF